jgi:hypothetical protein
VTPEVKKVLKTLAILIAIAGAPMYLFAAFASAVLSWGFAGVVWREIPNEVEETVTPIVRSASESVRSALPTPTPDRPSEQNAPPSQIQTPPMIPDDEGFPPDEYLVRIEHLERRQEALETAFQTQTDQLNQLTAEARTTNELLREANLRVAQRDTAEADLRRDIAVLRDEVRRYEERERVERMQNEYIDFPVARCPYFSYRTPAGHIVYSTQLPRGRYRVSPRYRYRYFLRDGRIVDSPSPPPYSGYFEKHVGGCHLEELSEGSGFDAARRSPHF